MSVFTDKELEYLGEQRLGRLATVDQVGNPHVVPVAYRYNPPTDTIDIGGLRIGQTKKYRDAGRHPRVAFVVDDVLPPWQPRFLEIRADAELLDHGGKEINNHFADEMLRLHPVRVLGWGINPADGPRSR